MLRLSSLVAVCLLAASTLARADDLPLEPPKGVTMSKLVLYGQGFSSSNPDVGGWSAGMALSYDWISDAGRKHIDETGWGFGLVSEVGFGMGHYTRDTEGRIGFDLSADVLGGGLRLRAPFGIELGAFYEPLELVALSVGGFIGSKLELFASWKSWQLSVGRGGNGVFYGFLPAPGGAMHHLEVSYRAPSNDHELNMLYGARLTSIPIDGYQGATAISLGLFVGLWLE